MPWPGTAASPPRRLKVYYMVHPVQLPIFLLFVNQPELLHFISALSGEPSVETWVYGSPIIKARARE